MVGMAGPPQPGQMSNPGQPPNMLPTSNFNNRTQQIMMAGGMPMQVQFELN